MGLFYIPFLIHLLSSPVKYSNEVDEEYPCGVSTKNLATAGELSNRIRGGWEASPYSLPWQVRIFKNEIGEEDLEMCGGTLVPSNQKNATDLVITAAHCIAAKNPAVQFTKPESLMVFVGAHDFEDDSEPGREGYLVKRAVGHKRHKKELHNNDIALLQLETPVPYTEYTRPACLPEHNQELPFGVTCVSSGWGFLGEGGAEPSKLQMYTLKIKPHDECTGTDHSTRILCTEGQGDICTGDSGGPLVCPINDRYTLFGVGSYGNDGCTDSRFTSVPSYIQWYKRKMRKLYKLDLIATSTQPKIEAE